MHLHSREQQTQASNQVDFVTPFAITHATEEQNALHMHPASHSRHADDTIKSGHPTLVPFKCHVGHLQRCAIKKVVEGHTFGQTFKA